jgi:hypothetical protein
MQGSPHRPFVPRLTPTRAQPAIGSSDFAVTRPFIPGADRERVESLTRPYEAIQADDDKGSLPSIEAFLDNSIPVASARGAQRTVDESEAPFAAQEDELPPVEHFVDPLPSVGDYAHEATADGRETENYGFAEAAVSTTEPSDGGEWGDTDWQQFDWRSAARLGETGDMEATNAWAATDWDASGAKPHERRPTAAQALAIALDEIARRIRDGEVVLPIGGTPSDPGSIAASLAALLGINR